MSAYHLTRKLEAQALRQAAAALNQVAGAIEAQLIFAEERADAAHAYEAVSFPRGLATPPGVPRAKIRGVHRCTKCGQVRVGPTWRFWRDGAWHRDGGQCGSNP